VADRGSRRQDRRLYRLLDIQLSRSGDFTSGFLGLKRLFVGIRRVFGGKPWVS
jgi:hypothetical protein